MHLGRRALAVLAAGLLSGCAMPSASPSPAAAGRASMVSGAWKGSLLYVGGDQKTYVIKYPGGELLGSIPTGSFGMCSDLNGNVFATRVKEILEFPHGGMSPLITYRASGTVYSCSVDPTTQNLAAVVFCLSGCGDEVDVYRRDFGGPPTVYHDSKLHSMLYCGYDGAGNLFVDGYDKQNKFMIAELRAGAQSFTNIRFRDNIAAAGQIQWDGTYMTVETRFQPKIYRLKLTHTHGRIVGTTQFTSIGSRAGQSWIAGKTIIIPTGPGSKRPKVVGIWKYPQGGDEINRFSGFIPPERQIDGLTLSVLPGG